MTLKKKFEFFSFIYMMKIRPSVINSAGKSLLEFLNGKVRITTTNDFSEILGGEALRTLVANHLFWSTDRLSQEGQAGRRCLP